MPEDRYRRRRSASRSVSPRDLDRDSRSPTPCKRLHLADLDQTVTKSIVEDTFGKYGKLADVWVATYPPYFGFVVFDHAEDADRALKAMKRGYLGDCPIRTTVALPRGSRRSPKYRRGPPSSSSRYGGSSRYVASSSSRSRVDSYRSDRDRYDRGGDRHERYDRGGRSRSRSASPPRRAAGGYRRSRSRSPEYPSRSSRHRVEATSRRNRSPVADDISD